ncbi:MAG: Rieske (2Fe-2S) protein [Chitinophagaceae bacterium]|nr:Rieske (2Fe-2S) protein [Chitinophagaceae bacterium]
MQRRDFIKTSCLACISGLALSAFLESCGTTHHITANISGSDLIIPLAEFQLLKNELPQFKKYLVVQNDSLQYPICIYRLDEKNYTALWMRCTHQGAELQVFGDRLQCPAHGSEFSNTGKVSNSPATENLKTFPVTIENNQLRISLQ